MDIERTVDLFVDFHGHSRKRNLFMYGCQNEDISDPKANLLIRVLPSMLNQKLKVFS